MAYDYAKTQVLASKLITKFGQVCTLSRTVMAGPEYNQIEGTPQEYQITAVDLNIVQGFERDPNASLKAETKRTLLIKVQEGFAPKRGDVVTISGVDCTLGECKPLQPGGMVLMYTAELES